MSATKMFLNKTISTVIAGVFLFQQVAWADDGVYVPFDDDSRQSSYLTLNQLQQFSDIKDSLIQAHSTQLGRFVSDEEAASYLYSIINNDAFIGLSELGSQYKDSLAASEKAWADYTLKSGLLEDTYNNELAAQVALADNTMRLAAIGEAIASLEVELAAVSAASAGLAGEIAERETAMGAALGDVNALEARRAELADAMQALKGERALFQVAAAGAGATLDAAAARRAGLEAELGSLRGELSGARDALTLAQGALEFGQAEYDGALALVRANLGESFDVRGSGYERVYDASGRVVGATLAAERQELAALVDGAAGRVGAELAASLAGLEAAAEAAEARIREDEAASLAMLDAQCEARAGEILAQKEAALADIEAQRASALVEADNYYDPIISNAASQIDYWSSLRNYYYNQNQAGNGGLDQYLYATAMTYAYIGQHDAALTAKWQSVCGINTQCDAAKVKVAEDAEAAIVSIPAEKKAYMLKITEQRDLCIAELARNVEDGRSNLYAQRDAALADLEAQRQDALSAIAAKESLIVNALAQEALVDTLNAEVALKAAELAGITSIYETKSSSYNAFIATTFDPAEAAYDAALASLDKTLADIAAIGKNLSQNDVDLLAAYEAVKLAEKDIAALKDALSPEAEYYAKLAELLGAFQKSADELTAERLRLERDYLALAAKRVQQTEEAGATEEFSRLGSALKAEAGTKALYEAVLDRMARDIQYLKQEDARVRQDLQNTKEKEPLEAGKPQINTLPDTSEKEEPPAVTPEMIILVDGQLVLPDKMAELDIVTVKASLKAVYESIFGSSPDEAVLDGLAGLALDLKMSGVRMTELLKRIKKLKDEAERKNEDKPQLTFNEKGGLDRITLADGSVISDMAFGPDLSLADYTLTKEMKRYRFEDNRLVSAFVEDRSYVYDEEGRLYFIETPDGQKTYFTKDGKLDRTASADGMVLARYEYEETGGLQRVVFEASRAALDADKKNVSAAMDEKIALLEKAADERIVSAAAALETAYDQALAAIEAAVKEREEAIGLEYEHRKNLIAAERARLGAALSYLEKKRLSYAGLTLDSRVYDDASVSSQIEEVKKSLGAIDGALDELEGQRSSALGQLRNEKTEALAYLDNEKEKAAHGTGAAAAGAKTEIGAIKDAVKGDLDSAFARAATAIEFQEKCAALKQVFKDSLGREPSTEELSFLAEKPSVSASDILNGSLLDELAARKTLKEDVIKAVSDALSGMSEEERADIIAYLESQSLHFGMSASLPLVDALAASDIKVSEKEILTELILAEIRSGNLDCENGGPLAISMAAIAEVASERGLDFKGYELDLDTLSELIDKGVRAIAHLKTDHYVTVTKVASDNITYLDPSTGKDGASITLSKADFAKQFSGRILTDAEPNAKMRAIDRDVLNATKGAGFFDFIGKFFDAVGEFFSDIFEAIGNAVSNIVHAIGEGLKKAGEVIVGMVQNIIQIPVNFVNAISEGRIGDALWTIGSLIPGVGAIKSAIDGDWAGAAIQGGAFLLSFVLPGAGSGIGGFLSDVLKPVTSIASGISSAIGNIASGVSNFLGNIGKAVTGFVGSIAKPVIDVAGKVVDFVKASPIGQLAGSIASGLESMGDTLLGGIVRDYFIRPIISTGITEGAKVTFTELGLNPSIANIAGATIGGAASGFFSGDASLIMPLAIGGTVSQSVSEIGYTFDWDPTITSIIGSAAGTFTTGAMLEQTRQALAAKLAEESSYSSISDLSKYSTLDVSELELEDLMEEAKYNAKSEITLLTSTQSTITASNLIDTVAKNAFQVFSFSGDVTTYAVNNIDGHAWLEGLEENGEAVYRSTFEFSGFSKPEYYEASVYEPMPGMGAVDMRLDWFNWEKKSWCISDVATLGVFANKRWANSVSDAAPKLADLINEGKCSIIEVPGINTSGLTEKQLAEIASRIHLKDNQTLVILHSAGTEVGARAMPLVTRDKADVFYVMLSTRMNDDTLATYMKEGGVPSSNVLTVNSALDFPSWFDSNIVLNNDLLNAISSANILAGAGYTIGKNVSNLWHNFDFNRDAGIHVSLERDYEKEKRLDHGSMFDGLHDGHSYDMVLNGEVKLEKIDMTILINRFMQGEFNRAEKVREK
ncbi:MAG: hypothetical protein JW919_03285 [Candidatus Omnitrophica bacterium]|nr:hypothetical protein [Candidatus Omnitrophota bacterium]